METAVRETRLATALALGAAALFVFPLYVVPENTLPPAQWAEKPRDIFVLQTVTVALWLLSVALAAVGTVLSWTRASRFTAALLAATTLAILGSVLASTALVVRWFAEVPADRRLAAPGRPACPGLPRRGSKRGRVDARAPSAAGVEAAIASVSARPAASID